jgi:hypoxanthine phosphoribosyltransferase
MISKDNVEPKLQPPLAHVIYTREEIASAVRELAVELLAATPYDEELILLVVLEGARRFGEDLTSAIHKLPQSAGRVVTMATVGVSSYGHATQSSGIVKIVAESTADLSGRHVVLVDDILDQGHTLTTLMDYCQQAIPATIRSCVLFDKRDVKRDFIPDFVGLEVPKVFVVGYGLDYQEKFRNLPYLAALDEALIQSEGHDQRTSAVGQRERT